MSAIFALLPALATADAAAGKRQFAAQCGLCHTAQADDDGGAQGPSLIGVFGHRAATTDPTFSYTDALKRSKLVWTRVNLDRFLTNPAKLVPGTAMPMAVADKADRASIVDFFQSLATPKVGAKPSAK